jgi:Ternary complex associated domain 9
MTTTTSPIEQAIRAASILFDNLFDDTTKIFIDDSYEDLESLTKQLIQANCQPNDPSRNESKINTVLIRIGNKQARKHQPYADLLESLINKNKSEISCSIKSIVVDSIAHGKNSASEQPDSSPNQELYSLLSKQRLTISFDKINDLDKRNAATENLLNWGKLESFSDNSKNSFSRFVGGIKPLVYIFDDYNNLIDLDNEVYQAHLPSGDDYQKIQKYYSSSSSSQSSSLGEAVKEFCICLNQLSLAFDVRSPKIEFDRNRDKCFEIVEEKLNFPKLDRERNLIAAFIIDIEWLPSPEWILAQPDKSIDSDRHHDYTEEMGHIAVRLLSQRYPEIPCFVFTGMWSIETLQKSLAAGAAWCFQKPITHHLGKPSQPGEELNSFNLERHLNDFAKRTYGTYEQLPKPDQFNAQSNTPAIAKLEQSMEMKFPKQPKEGLQDIETLQPQERKQRLAAENFKHLIARSFTADRVEVLRVMGSGKSGAAATFFVSPTSDRLNEATRFVKIGTWLEIQKEYAAYEQVIKPKLNNHIARTIQPPAVISDQTQNPDPTKITWANASLVSSLAGFPESYNNIRPLKDIFDEYLDLPGGHQPILDRIIDTINFVIFPLQLPTITKTYSFVLEFPCFHTGELIPLSQISPISRTPDKTVNGKSDDISLKKGQEVYLQEWLFTGISPRRKDDGKNDDKYCDIFFTHQETNAWIRLRGETADVRKRFGAVWLKLGMPVSLDVKLDENNSEIDKIKKNLNNNCLKLELDLSIPVLLDIWARLSNNNEIEDPISLLSNSDEIIRRKLIGTFGGIHGDLNLHNIQYPKENTVGFLIDFDKSKLEGLSTYDLAWLEAQIWNHYLFPNIVELAKHLPSTTDQHPNWSLD